MNQIGKSLRDVSLFRDLPEDLRCLVERSCRWRNFRTGEEIVSYQDVSRDVHFMVSGQARVIIYSISGKVVAFRDIGAGDLFGEFAAIDERPRSASVEAKTDGLVASMSAQSFRKVLADEPCVALPLIRHLVTQIRLLTDRVFEFSTLAVNNRIHAELLRLVRQVDPSSNEVCLSPAPAHAEIASRISTHREAVSRELSRLAHIGLLQRQDSSLLIKDVERLARMVREATGD